MFSYLISFIICLTTIFIFEAYGISIGITLFNIISGLLLPNFFKSIIDLTDNKNWKSSQRKLKRAGLLQKDTPIRISFAYLFRIKIDGQYFLVQNTRSEKYQPVGGTYKFELKEANYLAEHIPVENDDRIPVDQLTKRDYRLLVKSKDLRNFVKRFERTPYRENINNLSREFQEELFTTNILDKNSFGDLSYKYCGRHMTNIEYGNVFNHFELLLADIIEVRLSTTQEELFRRLMERDCIKYRFAKPNEIKSYGVRYETNELTDDIANHTPKILSENTDNLILRKKHKEEITIQI
ncbi:hypothetical protein K2V78_14815 [Mammaliicoccus sciuri]|nr:hypothetical protein [Mammaliicoccus sciuri]